MLACKHVPQTKYRGKVSAKMDFEQLLQQLRETKGLLQALATCSREGLGSSSPREDKSGLSSSRLSEGHIYICVQAKCFLSIESFSSQGHPINLTLE